MQADEIRSRFLNFFEKRGHKIIPSSSLVPLNDLSVLFTTAGMQQFKPYYTNPKDADQDFGSKNVVTAQKCIRTGDIDEVGDSTHLTFFEMLGNFSFGGYGRREAITYAYDFITKELGLKISYVTVYKGEGVVSKDEESKKIWTELDSNLKILESGSDVFWGPTGDSGPCGPTTEIYCKNADGQDVEIWNIVFNEYFCAGSREQLDQGKTKLKKLDILGIDTGMGFERLLATVQKKKSVYETDLFNNEQTKEERIIADHIKASIFMISDGVIPSNTGRGYVLRRLLRRIFARASLSKLPEHFWIEFVFTISKIYINIYPKIKEKFDFIVSVIKEEEKLFEKPLNGIEIYRSDLEAAKLGIIKKRKGGTIPILKDENTVSGLYIYRGFETYGNPIDLSIATAKELGFKVDEDELNKALKEHQEKSRTASIGMFKGGLANHNEKTIKLHTAHHLLLAGLQAIVDENIKQRGSNITEERLRLDFLCDHKLTDEEKKKVENWVNDKIQKGLNVVRKEMPLAEAQKIGAEMEFGAKYPDIVSVYFIEDKNGNSISKEFCGGPHVTNTAELYSSSREQSRDSGPFKIQKEEAVAKGIRRIKAILL